MPDKRNDNKIMSILERSGVIRKTGADAGAPESDSSGFSPNNESDIKPLFNIPEDTVKVTPAARQPIPGMPTPVFPSDRPAIIVNEPAYSEQIDDIEDEIVENESLSESDGFSEPSAAYEPATVSEPMPSDELVDSQSQSSEPSAAPSKPSSPFGGFNLFRNGNSQEEPPPPAPPVAVEKAPQQESYTDRFLNTEELYDALALRSKKTDTIYLIEEYLQTLPDSLPDASRRDIVHKLIAASGFDYDFLMGDGVLRVKMLKEYAERFARHTDDYIAARQAELDEMDQQILRTRRLIENRKELHKKQFFSIEAEAQRLKEILTFVSG
ncbi:MAG: hypothetical protein LBD23_15645 [Oscillospiraceae bacterium]|jgi:hypothetical protein|nr:hypothetical protein [Oscillospiraceae bacterium]